MARLLRRVLAAVVVIVIVLAGAGFWFLRTSLPQTDGTIALAGIGAEIRITRDAHGVPTIRAASEHDAAFALGFLHAQDRLFGMDMIRRYGAGRLSEVYGTATLGVDRSMRTLGLYRAAEAQYAGLSAATRDALDAYAAGVNAFLASRHGALPPEYYLLGVAPEPWRPADSLVWGKIMDLQLAGNYRGELLRSRLLQRISADDLAILYPAYPKDGPVALADARAALNGLDLDRLYALLAPLAGPQAASNNWVVDGAHSLSGKPVLANDPHLDFAAPGVWYLARIETPAVKREGVTAPGTPFLIIGHNERIAWGFTTTGSDVEDLFIEKPDPVDPGRYLTPDGSRPFVTRQEMIGVKGADPVTLTVRETRHGPVISDLAGEPGGTALALQATWLGADDRTPQAIWELGLAQDWQGFRAALENMVAPQQNIVYADVDGNIGFLAPARVPIRAKGDGWLPSPGWSDEYAWTGTIPYAGLPSAFNPPSGRIVTANNKIVPDDYPYFLNHDWELPYRAQRITALLDATPQQSPEASATIQSDDLSLSAKELLPLLLGVAPSDERARAAVARLKAWDARMDRDRPEPLIFIAWLRELNRELLAERLGPMFPNYWSLRPNVISGILVAHNDWCGDGGCPAALSRALDRALADLAQRYGTDIDKWQWGAAHQANFASALWSRVPVLGYWFGLAVRADGAEDTVDAAAMFIGDEAAPFTDRHGPTLRMIVDLAAPDQARFMITPGESGNPLSPHWGDLLRPWRDVTYFSFGKDASGGTLVLEPR